MNRRFAFASALAVMFGGSVSLAEAPASIGSWQAGTNYQLLERPRAPQVARGKVEVNEIFWYGCGHCYALDPTLENWKKKKKPAFIEFVRTPVIWGPMHKQHARLYYTLQALNRSDLHPKVFEAIHRKGNMLASQNSEQARAMHLAFLKENGVTEQAFAEAYESTIVSGGLSYAEQITGEFAVASVPILVVQGKYSTNMTQAGGEAQLLSLITDLAKSEKRR